MAWRVQSLSEDSVDSYTHTWSVAFLILLTFLTLGISMTQYEAFKSEKYRASCWQSSNLDFANKVCSMAFNALITGRNYPRGSVNIFRDSDSAYDYKGGPLTPVIDAAPKGQTLSSRAPVILFVLAICLRLPKMLWAFLSTCNGCVNLDQTLLSAKAGDSMDQESRRQLHAGLVKTFLDCVRTSGKTSTCVYILMKIAMIVVIIIEILVVAYVVVALGEGKMKVEEEIIHDGSVLELDLDKNSVYYCKFRKPGYTTTEVTGCAFEKQESALPNVFILVLTLLVILAVANVLNTAIWLVNLCGQSSRGRMGLRNSAPHDLLLLLQMARANLSVGVAKGLADIAAVNSGDDNETLELMEKGNYL